MSDLGPMPAVGGPHAQSTPQSNATPPGETERRKSCILNGLGGTDQALFSVAPNPDADATKPFYESASQSQVAQHSKFIDEAAAAKSVPADLIRAIMYMETTHGYYDKLIDWTGKNKSILPMNINVQYWGDAFGTRKELENPRTNVLAGAEMLARIMKCMPDSSSVEQIATVYNHLGARKVNDYGARVGAIHRAKLWDTKK